MLSNKYALVISITYKNNYDVSDLEATENDGNNMERFLKTKGYKVIHMNDHNIDKTSNLYPTRNNIYIQIRNILRKATTNDMVFIYYAGHGIQLNSSSNNTEEVDRKDECIIPVDYSYKNQKYLSDDVMSKLISVYTKNKTYTNVFLMFDCCHSGTICDMKYTYNYNKNTNSFDSFISNTLYESDAKILVLSGCKDDGVSWEDYFKDALSIQGILTGSFLHNIKTNRTLEKDIFKLVVSITPTTNKYNQIPSISSNYDITNNEKLREIFSGRVSIGNVVHTTNTNNTATNVNNKYNWVNIIPKKKITIKNKNKIILTDNTTYNINTKSVIQFMV
jgi:hypothetical protein